MKEFKYFSSIFLKFSSPFWLLILLYLVCDPFYVLRNHGDLLENYGKSFNRDRNSTQTYLNYEKEANFKSFIFGNSKSSGFQTKEWGKYINDTLAFHYDASNEFISGIKDKISFFDKRNVQIKNALIVLDNGSFEYPIDSTGTIFIKDYRVSPSISFFQYHLTFIKSFFKDAFFVRYFDFMMFKKFRNYMYGMLESRNIVYLKKRNDFLFDSYEKELAKGELQYYEKYKDAFFDRENNKFSTQKVIKPYQIEFLKEISVILKKQNTNYKIILDPSYSQIEWHKDDLEILKSIFGSESVYNFSGKNKFSNSKNNFYEIYHYRPHIGAEILKEVYLDSNELKSLQAQ